MVGTAGISHTLHPATMVTTDIYVHACRIHAHSFQYAVALLVRCTVPEFLLCKMHLRGVYILGGICGGSLYMAAYNIFPYFRPMTDYSFMLGASASVLAIVAATAYREPNYPIRLLLFGTIRLKYLALIVIGTDLLFITSSNAGGHIAHLGGALAGVWFAASLSKGSDLTSWINKCLDTLVSIVSFKPRKPKMKYTTVLANKKIMITTHGKKPNPTR